MISTFDILQWKGKQDDAAVQIPLEQHTRHFLRNKHVTAVVCALSCRDPLLSAVARSRGLKLLRPFIR